MLFSVYMFDNKVRQAWYTATDITLKIPTYRTKTQVFNIFMWQYKCLSPYTGNGNCQNGVLLITWQSKSKHIRHVVKSVYKMKEQYYYWNHCTKVFGRIWNWHSCVYVSQRVLLKCWNYHCSWTMMCGLNIFAVYFNLQSANQL